MSPEDERFVEQLRQGYAPPEMTAADRTRFDARLQARIAARDHRQRWMIGGGLLTAVAAAAMAVFWVGAPVDPPPSTASPPPVAVTPPGPPTPGPAPGPESAAPSEDEAAEIDALALALDTSSWGALTADPFAETEAVDDGATDDADAATADDDSTEDDSFLPADYEALAMLIDVDPYDDEELW